MAAKVLLVEDDNNLREIYEARLMAEGYNIVTARDGEEALVVAKAETPDLVISDVMMPRVSGFEMLDILRNTETLKDTKVIMLTALGQADDKTRANSLGADRYLVKSQVTLEDIVKTAHELIEGTAPQVTPVAPAHPVATTTLGTMPPATPPVAPAPMASPVAPVPPASAPIAPPAPVIPAPPMPPLPGAPTQTPTMAPPTPSAPTIATPNAPSVDEERASIGAQIDDFVKGPVPTPTGTAATQDDAVLANAMHDLATNTDTPPAPEEPPVHAAPSAPEPVVEPTPQPVTPAPAQPAVAVVPPLTPAPSAAEQPSQAPAVIGSVTIANKKIIRPLGESDSKPSIHELMAREEANSITNNSPMGHTPPTPSTTFSPNGVVPPAFTTPMPPAPAPGSVVDGQPVTSQPPVQPPPAQPNDFDPNNISL